MSFHRATVVALAAVFTVGMTSLASACCNWGYFAPVVTNQMPVAPAPIYVGPWSGSWSGQNSVWSFGPWLGCGCWVPRSSFYVVNQGPEYSGPGLMVPYVLYSPTGLASLRKYPYISGHHHRLR